MAYDPVTKSTILFGGYNSSNDVFCDTWSYAAGVWSKLNPVNSPICRADFVLVYDPPLKGLLLYGGWEYYPDCACDSSGADTWLFSHGNWTQLKTNTSPTWQQSYAMAYDPIAREVVLYGWGTWAFNGTDWKSLSTPAKMPAVTMASMSYSPLGHELVLTGGFLSNGWPSNETWAFANGHWHRLLNSHTPAGLVRSMTATLPNGEVLLFGGNIGELGTTDLSNKTYAFNGTAWHPFWTLNAPASRMAGGLDYDMADGYLVEFGGAGTGVWLNDTWKLG